MVGSAMKYFRMSEWDIKWKLSWKNLMLYMSSIPDHDDYKPTEPEIKVMDAADIF